MRKQDSRTIPYIVEIVFRCFFEVHDVPVRQTKIAFVRVFIALEHRELRSNNGELAALTKITFRMIFYAPVLQAMSKQFSSVC